MKQNITKVALNLAVRSIHRIFILFVVFGILTTSTGCHKQPAVKMQSLVNAKWLNEHRNDPDIVIIDVSVIVSISDEGQFSMQSGKTAYASSHIPNAVFADLLGDLSATDTDLDFVMPPPQQFQKAISALGISNDSRVVIYSTKPSYSWPQRLWWMMKWVGHDNVAVLDGGFTAWIEAGFPVSNKPVNRVKTQFKIKLRNEIIAHRDEVYRAISDKNITIIDALPETHYRGDFSWYARPGHIKSAINIPATQLFTDSEHFIATDKLNALFKQSPTKRIITYCGGGGAASSTAFTLHLLGYKNVAVYMGSLQEWVVNNENPMSVEDKP